MSISEKNPQNIKSSEKKEENESLTTLLPSRSEVLNMNAEMV